MPFWPPNTRPMNIRSSVSRVRKNAVLKVFPILVSRSIRWYAEPADSSQEYVQLNQGTPRNSHRYKKDESLALSHRRGRSLHRPFQRLIEGRLGFVIF